LTGGALSPIAGHLILRGIASAIPRSDALVERELRARGGMYHAGQSVCRGQEGTRQPTDWSSD